jgi:hypothetical protein
MKVSHKGLDQALLANFFPINARNKIKIAGEI